MKMNSDTALITVGVGGVIAWLAYNWYESSQAKTAAQQANCPAPAALDAVNQAGALAKSAGATEATLAPIRAKLQACGYTPTF